MPDGRVYSTEWNAPWSIPRKAERDYPDLTYARVLAHPGHGLWRDVLMRTPDGRLVERRVHF